jgi:hypothetical protein
VYNKSAAIVRRKITIMNAEESLCAMLDRKVHKLQEHHCRLEGGDCYISVCSDLLAGDPPAEVEKQYNAWIKMLGQAGIWQEWLSFDDCRVRQGDFWYTFLATFPEAKLEALSIIARK